MGYCYRIYPDWNEIFSKFLPNSFGVGFGGCSDGAKSSVYRQLVYTLLIYNSAMYSILGLM